MPAAPIAADTAEEKRERIVARSRERYGVEGVSATPPAAPPIAHSGDVGESAVTPKPRERLRIPVQPLADRVDLADARSSATAPSLELREPAAGRGGRQHRYLQELVRRWAESKGYRVTVEKAVLGGVGSIDVVLEGRERTIACEICVTTPVEHEVTNVQKCFAAGFDRVFVIAGERARAAELREALQSALTPTQAAQLQVVKADEFFTAMEAMNVAPAKTETLRGYRVKVKYGASAGDTTARDRVVADTVLGALRRLKSRRA